MDKKQEAFLRELLGDFKVEASEHLQAIVNGLLELEKKPPSPGYEELIEVTFREIHSLKGAARAVNLLDIERLCQSMEGVFHQLKQGGGALTPVQFDAHYKAVDVLQTMLSEVDKKEKSFSATDLKSVIKGIELAQHGQAVPRKMIFPAPPSVPSASVNEEKYVQEPVLSSSLSVQPLPERKVSHDTVRVNTSKLEVLLRQAEEFISVKATLGYYVKEFQKNHLPEQAALLKEMENFHRSVSRMVDDLLLDIKTTLLYPFSSLLEMVPKIVRDLGKEYGKEIRLSILGGDIEIDRRVLEEIKDPLIHLIRNCIDHGIETPKARIRAGKPAVGTLEIKITQESDRKIVLCIYDDGEGIDKVKVMDVAVKQGIVSADEAGRMSDKEVFGLIFRSGISTSPFITDISGRGLGMAIVAEKVLKLGGTLDIDSVPGIGTTFNITLPVTLSTFRGILVRINEQLFIVPTMAVERAVRISNEGIRTVESKQMITVNQEGIALVRLGDVLGLPVVRTGKFGELPVPVLIINIALRKIAFMVDEVLGEQEGMVKDLGPQLVHLRNIAGATISGNGRIIPILHVPELMESAVQTIGSTVLSDQETEGVAAESRQKHILVAEDSITSRSLLRNIIESAGYMVKTVVDGLEAFQFLQNEPFDLVVSDIEMPGMNGFELTTRIKSDKRLAEMPVVLVTALESAGDRQKGMEAGANAYIIKSSFEHSNLIATIRRLI